MKKIFSLFAFTILFTLLSYPCLARNNPKWSNKNSYNTISAAGCVVGNSKIYLDINNVRAMLLNGGDMWWDLSNARYEIPKVQFGGIVRNSIFTGALWIGGLDATGNLKIVAETYRQGGNDFFPGPLTTDSLADISGTECKWWDKHFKVDKATISNFITAYQNGSVANGTYQITSDILDWPAHGNSFLNQPRYLAPYKNISGIDDGLYDPYSGDYPDIKGDQAIWWVINDKGNNHTGTGGSQIGIEIHNLAYAFSTTNSLNDATFYDYKITNRSSNTLLKTYIGLWVDIDLGNYVDDYVGCDVQRGMGYGYNGDIDDEDTPWNNGYGISPPAIGFDFLVGPKAVPNDSIDNDRDGTTDELDESIIMSNFLYYNNNSDTRNGNPGAALNYYNYLRNIWRDGTNCTYDFKDGTNQSFPKTNFMFPGNTDPTGKWTGSPLLWDEASAGNAPGDRRFLQSAGPLTITPGQTVNFTLGAIWGRDTLSLLDRSISALKAADDFAQNFFNTGFSMSPDYSFSGNCGNLSVQFTDKSMGSPVSWDWNFGDGASATLQSPVHTYSGYGTYIANLLIKDSSGTHANISKQIIVSAALPDANIYYSFQTSDSVVFIDTSVYRLYSYWDFGDSTYSNAARIIHLYRTTGTYKVTLYAENACGTDTAEFLIKIDSIPTQTHKKEVSTFNNIKVYPNPASDKIIIDTEKLSGSVYNCYIFDTKGKKVINRELDLTENQNHLIYLSTEHLKNGLYIIKITGDSSICFGKIIVAR